ncbi:oligosaccharide flippase family protein [Roseateles sp.]|uniref:oligosaccharide flippase family protein n=1 Tax=Roseateles sp. TaxID=1971397 RepID=UPI002682407C
MNSQSLAQRTVSALAWTYAGAVARVLLQLFVQLVLARLLGPEDYGKANAAFFVLALGWMLAEGGSGAALVQKEKLEDEDIGFALGLVLTVSLAMGGAVVLVSGPIAQWLGAADLRPLIIASGLLIPLQALSNIPASLLRRQLEGKKLQVLQLGGYAVAYGVVGVMLAVAGSGPWTLVGAFATHSLISLLGGYAMTRHTLRPRWRGDRGLLKFGLSVTLANCGNWATENLDRLLVTRLWGTTALGAYTAAFTLSRAPASFLLGSVQSVAFAAASRVQNETEVLRDRLLATLSAIALVCWPLFAVMAVHASDIVFLLYGHRWGDAGPLFAAFSASLPFYAMLSVTGPLLWSIKAVRHDVTAQVLGMAALAACFFAWSDRPLAEAVWVVPFVYALRALWMLAALSRALKFNVFTALASMRGGAMLATLAVAICLLGRPWMPGLVHLAVSGLLVVGVSVCLLRIFPRQLFGPELTELLVGRAAESRPLAMLCRMLGLHTS